MSLSPLFSIFLLTLTLCVCPNPLSNNKLVINCLYLNIVRVQGRPIKYWQAGQSCANYLRKIGLIYVGADSITLRSIQ